MNVQPSFDENENMEVLVLPEDVQKRAEALNKAKEQKKAQIGNLKTR